ncbi:hypothetical protein GOV12_07715 [Candidatus Pacearchaeota archaeon]|nr:hypothetical protein [Candidatus Pacearchaeota archaeon]
MIIKSEQKKMDLNEFFNKNSGLLIVVSIFLIFLSFGKDFLPEIAPGIKLLSISEFLWLSGMLIVIICLISLIKNSLGKYKSLGVKTIGIILFLMFFCVIMYTLFRILLSEYIFSAFLLLPNSLPIAILIMISPVILMLINKIKIKWLFWSLHLLTILFSILVLIFFGGIHRWADELIKLNWILWFAFGLLISYPWIIYYKFRDRRKII